MKEQKNGNNKKVKVKKKLPGAAVASIVVVIFILLIGVACGLVYFNIGNSSSTVINVLKTRSSAMDVILKGQSDIAARELKLVEDTSKLATEKGLNDKKTEELKQAEINIKTQQDEVNKLTAQANQTLIDMKYAAAVYDKMETAKASTILSKMAIEDIIKIFVNINSNKVSEIMAAMDPKLASDLTKSMMPN